ncbi:MAG TPA: hypothetical protein VE779_15420 [Candidatus Angelobacter sp.]|nr:hypothetical protein [Candidatus Angelobacter sp.]
MRTTINLDDEAAEIAAQYARSRELSLSKAVSELIVRGTRRSSRIQYLDGLPVFDLSPSDEPLPLDDIKAMAEDE